MLLLWLATALLQLVRCMHLSALFACYGEKGLTSRRRQGLGLRTNEQLLAHWSAVFVVSHFGC